MSFLDLFALVILLVLVLSVGAAWVALAMLPGKIARRRGHPQADAIHVCGWWGAITLGLLTPIAFIWAYTDPRWREKSAAANSEVDGRCKDEAAK
jgi:hypothetical protein